MLTILCLVGMLPVLVLGISLGINSYRTVLSTEVRDEYYQYVFDLIRQDRENGGLFAGCNFWAWGGFAEQNSDHIYWEKGDDYTGDPAQEEQGLNSVFATDTTVEIIKTENAKLK